MDELRDLYDAGNRIVKALPKMVPKMAKASNSEELRSGFEEHLEQPKERVERLKQIFSDMDEKASGKKCPGMIGILQEGEEMIDEDFEGSVADAALNSAAQRVEHYEIAAYGCVRSWAQELGEEKETDQKLTQLAEQINASARSEGGEEGEEKEEGENVEATPVRKRKSRSAHA